MLTSCLFVSALTGVAAFSSSPAFLGLANRREALAASTTTKGFLCSRSSSLILRMAVSESGIETGVIKGIQEDSDEIDFGRCGVKLAEETAVRMSGQVILGSNAGRTVEWKEIDNIIKLTPAAETDLERITGVKVLATASAVEDYKDPGQGIIKEVKYAPDECAKAILQRGLELPPSAETTTTRIVINVAGGNDLQVSEVLDAVAKVSAGFDKSIPIFWNSLSYKEFTNEEASMVVVTMGNIDVDEDSLISGPAAGEIYMHNGKYWTVDENDIISDFSED